jgi:hypothetical protein
LLQAVAEQAESLLVVVVLVVFFIIAGKHILLQHLQ